MSARPVSSWSVRLPSSSEAAAAHISYRIWMEELEEEDMAAPEPPFFVAVAVYHYNTYYYTATVEGGETWVGG